jgi:hypothetical protein
MADIAHPQLHQITGSKLAIDRQIEQSEIAALFRNFADVRGLPKSL